MTKKSAWTSGCVTNTPEIRILTAALEPEESRKVVTASQLRGYIGYLFLDDLEFHHHADDPYHYPLIQYKKVGNQLIVLGLQQYADTLMNKIADVNQLVIPGQTIKIRAVSMQTSVHEIDSALHAFAFVSPWIALNRRNYEAFQNANAEDRKRLLEKILVGNVLSALKGLGIFVKHRLNAQVLEFSTVSVTAHGNTFEAINARFALNAGLPDYMGLGKSVSKGFGTIKEIK